MEKVLIFVFYFSLISLICHGQQDTKTLSYRIMSYNIHHGLGLDNVIDLQRVAHIINRVSPQVIAIQELDSITNRSGQIDMLSQLANLTRMYATFGASIPFEGGKYGVGILSKEKPVSWKRVPLPGREEARSLLIVEFRDYVVCCTHFSLNADDRLASVPLIEEAVSGFKKPVFLGGDINAAPESPVLTLFAEHWKMLNDPNAFTIPSNQPKRTIDYILGYSNGYTFTVQHSEVLNEPVASDHLPLFVDVKCAL